MACLVSVGAAQLAHFSLIILVSHFSLHLVAGYLCYKRARRNNKKKRREPHKKRGSSNCVRCVRARGVPRPVLLLRDKESSAPLHPHPRHSKLNWLEKQSIKSFCPVFHAIFLSPFHVKRLPLIIDPTYRCHFFICPFSCG